MRTRLTAAFAVLTIASTLLLVGAPAALGGTAQVVRATVCEFPVGVTTARVVTVTVTAPDEAAAGSSFDVDVLVEIDLPAVPPGLTIFDFTVRSEWNVVGPVSPNGPLTIETPPHDYVEGDTVIYETVTQSFTATGAAGDAVSYLLQDVDYLFAFEEDGVRVTADCVLTDAPLNLGGTLIVPASPTCLGQPVTISGTAGGDVLVGTGGTDVIDGGEGNDLVVASGGADLVCGGPGNDLLVGGAGADTLDGGAGLNILLGGAGVDTCTNGLALTC